MRAAAAIIATSAFVVAAGLAVLTAFFAVRAIEERSTSTIDQRLADAGLTWVDVSADGMLVSLTGTAPTEAIRFRALSIAGQVVDATRVIDAMDVTPALALSAPRFSLELLRNDDGISIIGLVPEGWDREGHASQIAALIRNGDITDMLESADFPVPDGWDRAVDFALVALRMLPRAKISVDANRISVTAISDSIAEKRRFETELSRAAPDGLIVALDISAPRPVITPFTLRFVIDEGTARFDTCAADTERARDRILAAAVAAGAMGKIDCTLGLGVPSPRWPEAAVAGIEALAALGAGALTISDVDVTLIAADTVTQEDFDRVTGDLTARLPEVFSLKATLAEAPREESAAEPPQFTATLSPEGQLQLRGRIADERSRDALDAFARARFGAAAVLTATRFDEDLPAGWGLRALVALAALAELRNGAVLMQGDRLDIRGVTGNPRGRDEITRILSDGLGQGAAFRVDVAYDERFDPNRPPPTPVQCVARANAVLAAGKIVFSPGSADIGREAARTLDDLAEHLGECGHVEMEIGGHTDSQGRAETNLRLSQRRAEAVLQALRGLRVPVGNLSAQGYGADNPIADNATEEGREANRRIAFALIGGDEEVDGQEGAEDGFSPSGSGSDDATDPEAETGGEGTDPPAAGPTALRPEPRPETLVSDETAAEDSAGVGGDAETGTVPELPDTASDAPADAEVAVPGDEGLAEEQEQASAVADPSPEAVSTSSGEDTIDEEPYDSSAPTEITTRPARRPADR